jgi:hypothetical protein
VLPKETEINIAVKDAAFKAFPELLKLLQTTARSAGWPERVTQSLRIEIKNGNLCVTWPRRLSKQVDDLEYGKPGQLPNPAIRPFINRSESIVGNILSKNTVDDLVMLEGVF